MDAGLTGWKRAVWTLGMVALWGLLGALSQYQWNVFSLDTEALKTIAVAIIAAVGMFATNWVAPWIPQYGRKE